MIPKKEFIDSLEKLVGMEKSTLSKHSLATSEEIEEKELVSLFSFLFLPNSSDTLSTLFCHVAREHFRLQ